MNPPESRASAAPPAMGEPSIQQSWLEWAAAQLDATLALGSEANGRLLTAIREILAQPQAPTQDGALVGQRAALIAAAQAHDRLTQQLSHVSTALRSLAQLAGAEATAADWAALRRRQLRTFSMREERVLFRRLVRAPQDDEAVDESEAHTGTIEFFD
jgi:hypothetical protein